MTDSTITLPIRQIAEETADDNSLLLTSLSYLLLMLPHFQHLPAWITGAVLFAVAYRLLQLRRFIKPMPRWILVILVLGGGIGVFAQFWTIVGRDAGLAMLSLMTAFKFLESRSHRDCLILIFLCYFLLATHFLFSQSILMALYTFANLILITTTLVTLNQRNPEVRLRERLNSSMRLVAYSLPLMVILFILVPRIPGPLWSLENQQRGGVTGLSDKMEPGEISDLIRSNEVAFRVDFEGPPPDQQDLYWRGPVMVGFNGRRWSQRQRKTLDELNLHARSQPKNYTITLEPNGQKWLFALGIPTRLIENSRMTADYQLIARDPINDLKRYTLSSILDYSVGFDESLDYLLEASDFPSDRNPRTIALGEKWAREIGDHRTIVNHALSQFREQPYVYTLQPPLLGKNPADEFLFDTRRGFCEHYSSSFALLMRAAGIPSRVVTGYQGGEYNAVGNYLIVRQSDAHAWAEVWLEDEGWVRVDPTAAVSPDRIEGGIDQALPEETSAFQIQRRNPLFGSILYSWDNLQHRWNDWVINYNDRKQRNFLRNLDVGIDNWSDMVFALVLLLLTTTGGFWLISWYRARPAAPPEYERLMHRLTRRLKRVDLVRGSSEDWREFVQRVKASESLPIDQASLTGLSQVVEIYQRVKYGPVGRREQLMGLLRRRLGDLRLSRS